MKNRDEIKAVRNRDEPAAKIAFLPVASLMSFEIATAIPAVHRLATNKNPSFFDAGRFRTLDT